MAPATDIPEIEARSLVDLRRWLKANHASSGSVWLVTFKKSHPDYVPWGNVVEELICWGWIDSAVRGIDEHRFKHLISPRKESSAWSGVNKRIVERMRSAKRMQPSGEAKIAAAQANGMWAFLDDVERLELPDDLAKALSPHMDTWESWSDSIKRGWLEKIKTAKTAPTRQKRIALCTDAAQQNLKNGGIR